MSQTRMGSFVVRFILPLLVLKICIAKGQVTPNVICPQIQVGEDDLPGFDIISQFHLDRGELVPGVSKVNGSSEYQVAYRLSRSASLSIPTR
uniref:collagen alpha-1(IX) chain-like n=1 Tax=Ciona intestinalis TaxID=7719 RepID=UPI00089DBA5B|nr:collagen alpha-1(IX) chain-like [Ciona intestinalis]|eukprot:XP_018672919.1 collagen alpha-1(IX) chain-like [Ciona intestinalis]